MERPSGRCVPPGAMTLARGTQRAPTNLKDMATIYRLTRLAASHRGGINQAIDADIRGVAKTNDHSPYTIANEVIAARLGQCLGLPVPAGVVAEHSGRLFYLSLDVSKEGQALPPIVATDFVAAEPWLAAGAVIFDIWIANSDRHTRNISHDPAFSPSRPAFFDHGHALLGAGDPIGLDRLRAAEGELGCAGRPPLMGNRHALLDLVSSAAALLGWVSRVGELPDFVIVDACANARDLGLLPDDRTRDSLRDWLQQRKTALGQLLSDHKDEFSAITQWDLDRESPT
jgi:hypothetical protein